jgi:hypothetical protein
MEKLNLYVFLYFHEEMLLVDIFGLGVLLDEGGISLRPHQKILVEEDSFADLCIQSKVIN